MTENTTDVEAAFDGIDELPESVDAAAVKRMQFVAKVLDESIRIPGTDYRIGIDPIIGLVPGGGDFLAGGLSLYIVAESARLGVSFGTLIRMLANVTLDVALGSVPYVGDLFDTVWKANKRNFELAIRDLCTEPRHAPDDAVEIEVE